MQTVLRLDIRALSTEEGGRKRALPSGYRGAMWFGETSDRGRVVIHDVIVFFDDRDQLAPGESATALAWVLAPESLPTDLTDRGEIPLVEGPHTVGHVGVLDLLIDDQGRPPQNANEAKTRKLSRG